MHDDRLQLSYLQRRGFRAGPRLCELAPPPFARGSQVAGFTQPRDHSFAQPSILVDLYSGHFIMSATYETATFY